MKILKSSRHSKITGDFAERLVLYWLSKHGFESALVDHTDLDIIARNLVNKELMGISVKSRSRNAGTENTVLRIDRKQVPSLDLACRAFGCKPYIAVVVDAADPHYCVDSAGEAVPQTVRVETAPSRLPEDGRTAGTSVRD